MRIAYCTRETTVTDTSFVFTVFSLPGASRPFVWQADADLSYCSSRSTVFSTLSYRRGQAFTGKQRIRATAVAVIQLDLGL